MADVVSIADITASQSKILVGSMIWLVILAAFSVYQLWLNYKQSKVNNQMKELLKVVKEIRDKIK